MPGTFSETTRPRRPGAYFNFVSEERETILPSAAGVVAIPVTHDWGPDNIPVRLNSFEDFLRIFGYKEGKNTAAYRAVKQAYQGEGLTGRGGAGQVLLYRFGAAVYATRVLTNSGAANALKVFGVYKGTRGNLLKVQVRAGTSAGKSEFLVFDGSEEIEKYVYSSTRIDLLQKAVNATSNWVRIASATATSPDGSAATSGVALTVFGPSSLSGGADGTAYTGATYSAVLDRLELERFGLFASDIDPTLTYGGTAGADIQASIATWTKVRNSVGHRFMSIVGGGVLDPADPEGKLLPETITTANTRSELFGDPNIVNLGGALVKDPVLGTLTTAQLAPRFAGILAQRGELRSATFARLSGVEVIASVTDAQIEGAFDSGTVVITRDNHPLAPVRIEKSITTYSSAVADERDPAVFGQPKYVRTMHGIEMEITEYVELNVIALMALTERSKEALLGELNTRLSSRVDTGILQPGASVQVRASTPDTAEYLELDYVIKFARSIEQVFNTVRIA